MKILTSRNNKDYYDYLTGIYGMDEKVVYDRREFSILSNTALPFFNHAILEKDAPKKEIRTREWIGRHWKWATKYRATELFCMLEIGLKWHFFQVDRYLDTASNVCLDWKIITTKEITKDKRVGIAPMTFFKAIQIYSCWTDTKLDLKVDNADSIPNPIIQGTPIASLIPAHEIYNSLYAYLSSLNDIEIIDNRTDIEKAESAGFDSKTSFRNIK